jgi:predicted ATPase
MKIFDMAGVLARATRILFFTGKGGVGKTSLACAAVSRVRNGALRRGTTAGKMPAADDFRRVVEEMG